MNNKKYMLLFLFIVCLSLFSFYVNPINTYDKVPDTSTYKTKTYISDEESTKMSGEDITVSKYYSVTLEDSLLCAYEITNGKKMLLNSRKINLLHLDKDEIKKLKEGINADSYEKMCMYFENYIS